MSTLDINFVRSCFPTFDEPLAAKTAFFENAGGSYVAGSVLDRLMHFYRVNKVQPYGACEILATAGEQMDAGRQAIAELLGISSDDLTIGASTTQNINTLAHACEGFIKSSSEIIVTGQDHEANIGAWERLCERSGAILKIWNINPQTAELELSQFEELFNENTAIVCMTHSSNIVGTINPVEKVIELCRQNQNKTYVVVDGVSFAPHQWPDIPTLKPDAYCFSTYKTFATHLGVMYTNADFRSKLTPQCHYFNREYPNKLLDSSGPDHASIAALAGVKEYFESSFQHHFGSSDISTYEKAQKISGLMHHHETKLCKQILDGIQDLPLRIIGRDDIEGREANIAITAQNRTSAQLSEQLARESIAAGHGHFYAKRLLSNTGIKDTEDGVLRISFAHYNNTEEVERTVSALCNAVA